MPEINDFSKKAISFLLDNKWLIAIVVGTFLLKLEYVFNHTDFKNYIVSDMGSYWNRATGRYDGKLFDIWQWTAWATGFHFYLTFLFKILSFLGYETAKRLEAVLYLNVIYSTLSVIPFYLIARKLVANKKYCLFVTLFYALAYPIFYLQSMVLSENVSIPLLIFAIYFVFYFYDKIPFLILSAICLGLATSLRPGMGLYGLSFFLYIILQNNKVTLKSLFKGIVFSLMFFSVVFLTVLENSYISKGELKGLAGNSAVNYFLQQCKYKSIRSVHKGIHTIIGPSTYAGGGVATHDYEFKTDRPIHDIKYFYALGNKCIKENKNIFFENLYNLKYMFIGAVFPAFSSLLWFDDLINFFKYITMFIALSLGLFFVMRKNKNIINKEMLFLLSLPLYVSITAMIFIVDYRYLVPVYFALYLIFFNFLYNMKEHKRDVLNYYKIAAALVAAYMLIY